MPTSALPPTMPRAVISYSPSIKKTTSWPLREWETGGSQLRCIEKEPGMTAKTPFPPVYSLVRRTGYRKCGLSPFISPWLLLGSLMRTAATAATELSKPQVLKVGSS